MLDVKGSTIGTHLIYNDQNGFQSFKKKKDCSPPLMYITNLQVSWVHSKSVQNLLFHKFVLFKHECYALFKHGSHVHDFCV